MRRISHLLASVRAWFFGKEVSKPDARQRREELRPVGSETMSFVTAIPLGKRRFKKYATYRYHCWCVPRAEVDIFESMPSCIRIYFPKAEPDYPRIGLDVVNSFIDLFPDPRLVKSLIVGDFSHPDQYWLQLEHNDPKLELVAEADPRGIIKLFRPTMSPELHRTLLHEWSHLHQLADQTASKVFDLVGNLEEFTTSSQSILTSAAEKWAILSEHWLGEDIVIAFASTVANPIRSAVWSKAFEQRLRSIPPELRGSRHELYVKRGREIRNACLEKALFALADDAKRDSPKGADAAKIVLNYLIAASSPD
jgi:hypothetical protein